MLSLEILDEELRLYPEGFVLDFSGCYAEINEFVMIMNLKVEKPIGKLF